MKVIIFGVGNHYKNQREKLERMSDIQVVAFTDNNSKLWGQTISDVPIIPPDLLNSMFFDKIVIMSTYIDEIYNQLECFNIDKGKIITWEQLHAEKVQGQIKIFPSRDQKRNMGGDILFITTELNYNGGSLCAVYGALALKKKNISVAIAAPGGNRNFIDEIVNYEITVALCPTLPYIYDEEKKLIEKFDIVLVNVLQMLKCAEKVCKIRPVLWWIHESQRMYESIIKRYPDCCVEKMNDINIYAVSRKAQENFNRVFPDRIKNILPYGIPSVEVPKKDKKNFVFAVIGEICSLKAQDIFLKASMKMRGRSQAEFWIIGKIPRDSYSNKIVKMAESISSVRVLGELTRREMYEAFKEIDVVVCTSSEETMSITITEAMMLGKICISTDNTGIADYIREGVNGFVVPVNDVPKLAEKMDWIVENKEKMGNIKLEARKTYEQYFSMDRFADNLQIALLKTKQQWNRKEEYMNI